MSPPIAATRTNTTANSVVTVPIKTRYTKSLDTTGWLDIQLEAQISPARKAERTTVCEFLKVRMADEKGGRTFFVIGEGEHRGRTASLKSEYAAKCLVDVKRGTGAKLVATKGAYKWLASKPRKNEMLHQLISTLAFDGHSAMITLDSDVDFKETNPLSKRKGQIVHSKPLPPGTYKIMTPPHPHKAGATIFYVTNPGGNPDLKYHTVWFPIEYAATQNSNFVHVGNLSEGCVTMYDLTMWNTLYAYLISNRLGIGEGKYVGEITIK